MPSWRCLVTTFLCCKAVDDTDRPPAGVHSVFSSTILENSRRLKNFTTTSQTLSSEARLSEASQKHPRLEEKEKINRAGGEEEKGGPEWMLTNLNTVSQGCSDSIHSAEERQTCWSLAVCGSRRGEIWILHPNQLITCKVNYCHRNIT